MACKPTQEILMPPRLYVYKLTTDNGGAPSVYRGLLSLAICKPDIRRTAKKGAWIFGFGGTELDGRLIYIACVTQEPVVKGRYFVDEAYEGRPDRIYRRESEGFVLRDRAMYHSKRDEREHDLGEPPGYANAVTLLSDDFRYWGRNGTCDYREQFPEVAVLLDRLRRKHRVNLSDAQQRQLSELRLLQWGRYPKKKVLGHPSQGDQCKPCNGTEGGLGFGNA